MLIAQPGEKVQQGALSDAADDVTDEQDRGRAVPVVSQDRCPILLGGESA